MILYFELVVVVFDYNHKNKPEDLRDHYRSQIICSKFFWGNRDIDVIVRTHTLSQFKAVLQISTKKQGREKET